MGATSHDLHIDKLLSEMAINYRPEGFIADMIAPVVRVSKQSDMYAVFDRGDRLRQQDTKRAPGTRAKQVIENVGSDTYFANNYALSSPVTIEDKANADPILASELVDGRTMLILDHLALDWEIRVGNQVTSGSNVGSYSAVGSAWNVPEGDGNPIADINAGLDNVRFSNGIRPNKVTFGIDAWLSFRRHKNVRNLIFGTNNGGGYPSTQQVADLLDVEEVQVGGAFQNTGEEGQSEALSSIWGDNVLMSYTAPRPTRETPSFMYTFRWAAAGLPQMQVERHPYDSRTKSEDVEAGYYQDEKITGSTYAFLLVACNSST